MYSDAGKEVGRYNTSKLWHLTDKSDSIFLKHLSEKPAIVSDAIENHVSETVITVNDEDEEEE